MPRQFALVDRQKPAARGGPVGAVLHQLGAVRRRAEAAPSEAATEALLRETRPDELVSREALDLLYRLKGLVAE
jgi:hypothetical protein